MQNKHKNNVLLTELVIVVLFFALIAVIVVQMFVAAHKRSELSVRTQEALVLAQDWAERLPARADPVQQLLDEGFVRGASESYALTGREDRLRVEVLFAGETFSQAGRLLEAELRVYEEFPAEGESGEPLVSLPVASYLPVELPLEVMR